MLAADPSAHLFHPCERSSSAKRFKAQLLSTGIRFWPSTDADDTVDRRYSVLHERERCSDALSSTRKRGRAWRSRASVHLALGALSPL